MYLPAFAQPGVGDTLTPLEINAELNHLVGEMNGSLDRENIAIAGGLLSAKFALDSFNAFYFVEIDTFVTVTDVHGGVNQWTPYVIPDATPVPWTVNLTTLDCELEIELHLGVNLDSDLVGDLGKMQLAIEVDGALVATNGRNSINFDVFLAKKVIAVVPVGAGAHVVRPIVLVSWESGFAVSKKVQFRERCLQIRQVRR